jgi:hypothetical protein
MRSIRVAVLLLALIGVTAAIMRIAHVDDLAQRLEPLRDATLQRLSIRDPHAAERLVLIREFDRSYAAHRAITLLHVLPGALILVLMLPQFSSRIRDRFPAFHRWSGRLTVLAGFGVAAAAFFFGIVRPFAGRLEAIATALFGGLFTLDLILGVVAARRRDFTTHRHWMIRAAALAFGIATIRLIMAVLDPLLTMRGVSAPAVFVASLWSGWIVMLLAAELWIRYSIPSALRSSFPPAIGGHQ